MHLYISVNENSGALKTTELFEILLHILFCLQNCNEDFPDDSWKFFNFKNNKFSALKFCFSSLPWASNQ